MAWNSQQPTQPFPLQSSGNNVPFLHVSGTPLSSASLNSPSLPHHNPNVTGNINIMTPNSFSTPHRGGQLFDDLGSSGQHTGVNVDPLSNIGVSYPLLHSHQDHLQPLHKWD